MAAIARLNASLLRAIDGLAVVLFALLFLVVLAQIGFRYLLGSPLVWSEELARYIFVWVCFLGWLMAVGRNDHIVITMVRDRLGRAGRMLVLVVTELASIVLAAVLLWYGWALAARNLAVVTVTLPFPFAVVYAIVPAAAALIILFALTRLAGLALGGSPRP
jgi:TRAP-type C4-dicarboxylate transport system permease small subunit